MTWEKPLDATARWPRRHGAARVAIVGQYRLSTGLAVGHAVRASNGFELEVATREGPWATDDRPNQEEPAGWTFSEPHAPVNGRLVMAIGIIRDPTSEAARHIGCPPELVLRAHLPEALTSAKAAQDGVTRVKLALSDAISRLQPSGVDLFYLGPASFAVLLGHRWNGLPPTQVHEFTAARTYAASIELRT